LTRLIDTIDDLAVAPLNTWSPRTRYVRLPNTSKTQACYQRLLPMRWAYLRQRRISCSLTCALMRGEQTNAAATAGQLAPQCAARQSGASGCLMSQSGRRLRTTGIVSKFSTGGGELVAHSSVNASHGSAGAVAGLRIVTNQFTRKTMMLSATM